MRWGSRGPAHLPLATVMSADDPDGLARQAARHGLAQGRGSLRRSTRTGPCCPASPATTVAGVVSHLRWVEWGWFSRSFPSTTTTPGIVGPPKAGEWSVAGRPVAALLGEYAVACADSRDHHRCAPPWTPCRSSPQREFTPVTLRWIVDERVDDLDPGSRRTAIYGDIDSARPVERPDPATRCCRCRRWTPGACGARGQRARSRAVDLRGSRSRHRATRPAARTFLPRGDRRPHDAVELALGPDELEARLLEHHSRFPL